MKDRTLIADYMLLGFLMLAQLVCLGLLVDLMLASETPGYGRALCGLFLGCATYSFIQQARTIFREAPWRKEKL
jgi:hypothetical protein